MRRFKVGIIGCGAAGMMAAIEAAKSGASVCIFEKNRAPGRKLKATGNGKCNFTNLYMKPKCYSPWSQSFVKSALDAFGAKETIDFFEKLGMGMISRDGYIYPESGEAMAVVNVLSRELERLSVTVMIGCSVKEVSPLKDGGFIITAVSAENDADKAFAADLSDRNTNRKNDKNRQNDKSGKCTDNSFHGRKSGGKSNKKEQFRVGKLIIAAGSPAGPDLGGSASGYIISKMLGHKIIEPIPALTGLRLDLPEKLMNDWNGVRFRGQISLKSDYFRELKCEDHSERAKIADDTYCSTGELILSRAGISGIPAFQLSALAGRALRNGFKVDSGIKLLFESHEYAIERAMNFIKSHPDADIEDILVGVVNSKLVSALINSGYLRKSKKGAGIHDRNDHDVHPYGIKKEEIIRSIRLLSDFKACVTGTFGFDRAQAAAGGVSLDEVDPETCGSRLVPDLYFAGEILDVDGICGGYNLQWAWSSGILAGRSCTDIEFH